MKDKIEKLKEFVKHKSFCNTTSNWDEAIQAMADTPEQFKDESWHIAYNEMREKMQICNCGLNKLLSELSALLSEEQPKEKALRYFKCPKCSHKFEFNGFPYWRPIAEAHEGDKSKLCKEKFIEITKEDYEKL